MKIISVYLERFRNEAHYDFYVELRALFRRYPNVQELVTDKYNALVVLHDEEALLVDAVHKSDYTQQIADTDCRIDRTITGLNESIKAALHHFNPTMVEAAERLLNRMKAFGNITRKAYHEENAAVRLLVGELRGDYAPQVAQLNLGEWVNELDRAQKRFDMLFIERNTEHVHKPTENTKEVRKKIDAEYHEMVTDIDANSRLNKLEDLEEFTIELNGIIDYFNKHNLHHKKKTEQRGE